MLVSAGSVLLRITHAEIGTVRFAKVLTTLGGPISNCYALLTLLKLHIHFNMLPMIGRGALCHDRSFSLFNVYILYFNLHPPIHFYGFTAILRKY